MAACGINGNPRSVSAHGPSWRALCRSPGAITLARKLACRGQQYKRLKMVSCMPQPHVHKPSVR
eukprot:4022337-Alexandrium_andersonii.AAC.1